MYIKNSEIRKAGLGDGSILNFLIHQCFSDVARRFELTSENFPVYPLASTPEKVEEAIRKGILFFIKIDRGIPSGYIGLENSSGNICNIIHMGVLPGRRQRGFGTALMEKALSEAKDFGNQHVCSVIITADTELIKWYEKFGFCEKKTPRENQLSHQTTFMQLSNF